MLDREIKTNLIDFLKKNLALKIDNFEAEINGILLNNLSKSDFVKFGENGKQVSIEISEKIEAKQSLPLKTKDSQPIQARRLIPPKILTLSKMTKPKQTF